MLINTARVTMYAPIFSPHINPLACQFRRVNGSGADSPVLHLGSRAKNPRVYHLHDLLGLIVIANKNPVIPRANAVTISTLCPL
eukprot:8341303-Pyramimonas_sp.AAC.1